MTRYLRLALGFYVLATALGGLLRYAFVGSVGALHFGHALHAHSHTLYFGWVGLALFALAFERLGARGPAASRALGAIAAISAATFVVFLEGGYSRPGIVVSSLALVVWGGATLLWWRLARGRTGLDLAFLRAALVYLLLACVGALARVGVLVARLEDPFWGRLAVFAFLHCFAGFFVLGVLGLLVAAAPALGVRLDEARLRRGLRVWAPLAWATFPLGVHGGSEGALGLLARAAALALLWPGALWVRALWQAARGAQRAEARVGLGWMALWLGAQLAMDAAGALGAAGWAVRVRHPAIIFLHVQLLGLVSGGLLLLVVTRLGGAALRAGLWLHHLGLALMVAGLGAAALAGFGPGGLARPGLLAALAGGTLVVAAGLALLLGVLGRRRQTASPPVPSGARPDVP